MQLAHAVAAAVPAEAGPSPIIPEPYDLLWGSVCFLIVLAVVIWRLLPAMNRALDARRDAIEGGIARADAAQAEATAALEQYNARLADARGEAATIRDQARTEAAQIVAEAREKAQAEADRILAGAHAQIAAERQSTLTSLRGEVGSLALDLAGGVIGETLTDDQRAKAVVDRFLAELEASDSAERAPA